jgi:DNA-binding HxlR family transcriptional regulator
LGRIVLVQISAPPESEPFETATLAAGVVDLVAGRWRVEILFLLDERRMRFNELLRALDTVSGTVLARVLRALEQDGLIERSDGYAITPLGETLVEALADLAAWGARRPV